MTDQTDNPENVVTHARFSGRPEGAPAPQPVDLDQLRKAGLVGDSEAALEDLNLSEPKYGETIIGTLTADEAVLYAAFHVAHQEARRIEREVGGNVLVKLGEKVRDTDEDIEAMSADTVSEEEAVKFFRARRKSESLKAILFWQLSERLGHHDWLIAVRTKARVVKVRRQW